MATSNGWNEQQKSWFWNGNKVTADRYRYELSRQQETTIKQVNDLITRQAADAVAPAAGFDQQQFGGLLRQVVPTLLDQYGQINATAAIQFYDQSREFWDQNLSNASQGGRDARRTAAKRYATARTQGAVKAAQGYAAQFADTYDTVSKTDAVVNWAMKVRAKSGHQPSVEAMQNALTREVAAYHRDTVLFNSALDPNVSRVQRVAQASACEFCRLMALGSTNGKVRVSTYAVKFHSHCHCTIQPLFEGEQPVRPDYYDKFEKEYKQASAKGTENTLENWRKLTKKANAATAVKPVEAPITATTTTATKVAVKAPKATTKPIEAPINVTGRTVTKADISAAKDVTEKVRLSRIYSDETKAALKALDNVELAPPDKWWWQRTPDTVGDLEVKVSQSIPLDKSGANLPRLSKPATLEEAAVSTNPKFDLDPKYKDNCARVAQVYELRRRGYDVTANGNEHVWASQSVGIYGNGWKNPVTGKTAIEEQITAKSGNAAVALIKSSFPNGARGTFSFQYSRKNFGHIMNWELVDGKVVWVDAQPGLIGQDAVRAFKDTKLNNFIVTRMDNLEPSAQVLHYIEGFDK